MRKLFSIVVMLFVLSISTVAFANYPTYLNGNRNYVLCDGQMGVGMYLDKSSLNVEKYAPPQYIISVDVVMVGDADRGKTEIGSRKHCRFFYNYDLRQMYNDTYLNDNWSYIPTEGSRAETMLRLPAGEMAFYLAYNMKFYGVLPRSVYNSLK